MTDKYILNEQGEPVVCYDLQQWAKWYEDNRMNRHVGDDRIGEARVSTVFLALDHSFGDGRPPILYETMVFGGPLDQEQERYTNKAEAIRGHERWLAQVRAAVGKSET